MNAEKVKNHKKLKKYCKSFAISLACVIVLSLCLCTISAKASPNVSINVGSTEGSDNNLGAIEILYLFTILSLAPSLVIMASSFTRIVIVLSFARTAIGTQNAPPNQIIIGLALFLTLFIMMPVIKDIDENAYKPYKAGTISEEQALSEGIKPLKTFMLKQVKKEELNLFINVSGAELPQNFDTADTQALTELDIKVIIPAFITSEIKRAFMMGFLLYIPFLIIDMVVSSTLMSMGMVMLPPATIATPFKILLFVLVDGWGLLVETLVKSFRL